MDWLAWIFIGGFVVFVIVCFILIEAYKWVEIYGGSQVNLKDIQAKVYLLKQHGIDCKLSTKAGSRLSRTITAAIKVKRGQEREAYRILNEIKPRSK